MIVDFLLRGCRLLKDVIQWGQRIIDNDHANFPFQNWIDAVQSFISKPELPRHSSSSLPEPWEGGIIQITDLNVIAHSDGVQWYRADTSEVL